MADLLTERELAAYLSSDRAESGRDPFFVGRLEQLHAIEVQMRALEDGVVGGRTMLFAGAPGAGKTALLQEAAAMAEARDAPIPSFLDHLHGIGNE